MLVFLPILAMLSKKNKKKKKERKDLKVRMFVLADVLSQGY